MLFALKSDVGDDREDDNVEADVGREEDGGEVDVGDEVEVEDDDDGKMSSA